MIMTVEELRRIIDTDQDALLLGMKLAAVELSIRNYTNNNFQIQGERRGGDIVDGTIYVEALTPFSAGDTVQISQSERNNGLYTVKEAEDSYFTVNEPLKDERDVLVTLVQYPVDVKLGAAEILKWKLQNEAKNSTDTSKKDIQSETISRHSVTYAQDATETDIDSVFGAPKKYMSFLKQYKKARF